MFITLEGIDGTGKGLLLEKLDELIQKDMENYDLNYKGIVSFREPGSTIIGEKIRSILLDKNNDMDPTTEFILYNAARRENVVENLYKAHMNNYIIICDRYYHSSIVYQSLRGCDLDFILDTTMKTVTYRGIQFHPDLIISIYSSDEKSRNKKISGREKDRLELAKDDFFREANLSFKNLKPYNSKSKVVYLENDYTDNFIIRIEELYEEYIKPKIFNI